MLASLNQSRSNKVLATNGVITESALLGGIAPGRLTTQKPTNPVVLRVKAEKEELAKARNIKIKMVEALQVADKTLKDHLREATPRNAAVLEAEIVVKILVVAHLVPKIAEEEDPRAQDEVRHEMETTRPRHVLDTCKENARRKIVSTVILLFAISFWKENVNAKIANFYMSLKKSHLSALQALRVEAMLG